MDVTSASTSTHHGTVQPYSTRDVGNLGSPAAAACGNLHYKSALDLSDPSHLATPLSTLTFLSCPTKITTAASHNSSNNITLLRAHHRVRVGTTLNNHNRPTRAATVVSLAINHNHSRKRSTFSSLHNRKVTTVAWRAWRVCACVVVRKSFARRVFADRSERVALLDGCS